MAHRPKARISFWVRDGTSFWRHVARVYVSLLGHVYSFDRSSHCRIVTQLGVYVSSRLVFVLYRWYMALIPNRGGHHCDESLFCEHICSCWTPESLELACPWCSGHLGRLLGGSVHLLLNLRVWGSHGPRLKLLAMLLEVSLGERIASLAAAARGGVTRASEEERSGPYSGARRRRGGSEGSASARRARADICSVAIARRLQDETVGAYL